MVTGGVKYCSVKLPRVPTCCIRCTSEVQKSYKHPTFHKFPTLCIDLNAALASFMTTFYWEWELAILPTPLRAMHCGRWLECLCALWTSDVWWERSLRPRSQCRERVATVMMTKKQNTVSDWDLTRETWRQQNLLCGLRSRPIMGQSCCPSPGLMGNYASFCLWFLTLSFFFPFQAFAVLLGFFFYHFPLALSINSAFMFSLCIMMSSSLLIWLLLSHKCH